MSQKNRNNFNNQKKVQHPQKPSFVSSAPKKEKTPSKFSKVSSAEQIVLTILSLIIFVAVAAYELITNNSDMLFMAQGHSLFTNSCQFFKELTTSPGCLIAYAGCYLTQFFYHPALGSSMLIALWCILFFLTKKAFRINNTWAFLTIIPVACILISIIDKGYWLYYLKQPGFYFRETLGFIMSVGIFYIASRLSRHLIAQCIFTVVAIFAGYYVFGWYALLAGIYLLIDELLVEDTTKLNKVILSIITVVALIATPLISYNIFFTEMRAEDAFIAGFPRFEQDKFSTFSCELPIIFAAVIPMFFPLVKKLQNTNPLQGFKAHSYRLVYLLIAVLGIPYVTDAMNFTDYDFHAECRMYRYVDEQRWDDVLEEAASYQDVPTREMVIFSHIALLNKGTMGSQLFHYNNFGKLPTTFDSLHVHMVQTAGPLIYLNHAKTNFASRWCIENSVEFGYNFNELKILVKCAIINGEWDVARKYLDILEKSIYYKEWAEKYEPLLADHSKMKQYHEFDYIKELYSHMGSTLDGDNGLCEMYLLNYFSNTMNKDSKALEELTLDYALIQKDIQLFWPRFFLYAQMHPKETMPIHYQEAAFLYGNLEHTVNIAHMPFDKDIPQRYASFQQVSQEYLRQGMTQEQVRDAMAPDFGNTFWWFYFFCRDVKSY